MKVIECHDLLNGEKVIVSPYEIAEQVRQWNVIDEESSQEDIVAFIFLCMGNTKNAKRIINQLHNQGFIKQDEK